MSHDQAIAFLNNKTYLATKFANREVLSSLRHVWSFHLTNGKWSIGSTRTDMEAMAVLEEFRLWKQVASAAT